MSRKVIRRKCRCCRKFFTPDYRNSHHQLFCTASNCRRASKAKSQRRWLGKNGNRDYFRDPDHVQRVREWRKGHPGYWKRGEPVSEEGQVVDPQSVNPKQRSCNVPRSLPSTLQDLCLTEHPAFLGLISMVTGSTLQEDIVDTARQVLLRGKNILGLQVLEPQQNSAPPNYDQQTSTAPR